MLAVSGGGGGDGANPITAKKRGHLFFLPWVVQPDSLRVYCMSLSVKKITVHFLCFNSNYYALFLAYEFFLKHPFFKIHFCKV